MEGSGSTGNPSAASSHKLPSDTNQHIFWPADWISAPGGAGGRSRESVTLLRSQDHQSSVEKPQEQAETLQSPRQKLQGQPENIQEAAEKPVENLDSPVESVQEPAATLQSSTGNLQEPAKTHQKTVENIHKPLEVPQNPLATLQSPAGEVDQLSLVQNHQYSPSEDFTIRAEQLKPHHPPPEEPEPGDSTPSTTLVPEDSLLTEPEQPPSIPDQTRQEALSPEQLEVEAPPLGCSPSALTGPPGPSSAGACRSSQHGEPAKDTPPPPLKALPAPPTANEQNHNIPSKDPSQQQAPPTLHLNGQQAPSTPHLNSQQAPLPAADQVLPSTFHQTGSTLDPPPQAPTLTVDGFSEQIQTRPLVSSTSEPKLCGFLLKQGGPLKTWKLRWFMHEDRKNQLFYYRTPQDVMPLGRIELCSATFTYPLKAETGTFHIKTPERTFILKAVNQELMHYWLQQLQVKRWQHRQTLTSPDGTGNTSTDDNFLPMLKSPLGLVGEEAATTPTQRTPLANMSIKHPLIEFQNSVHSLRKRSSQELSQSVFHVEAPPWTPSSGVDGTATASRTPAETIAPPPPTSLVEATGPVSLAEGRSSPSFLDGGSRKKRSSSSFSRQLLCRDAVSSPSERMSRLQQDKQMLMEEVKAQKELVWILHKALEASQLEKRTCAEFLAAAGEQERLELLRHGERRMADLQRRLEQEQVEAESLRRSLAQREAQLSELQEEVNRLTEKNDAKQEVIMKLSDQLANQQAAAPSCSDCQTFRQLQREAENLRDDMGAYRTQNRFLNSEIYQLTRLWRTSSEQEKSLMMKCAYLEASNCQVESRYLGVLRQLLETKTLDPVQRGAVQKMVEDALKRELKSAAKANTARDHDEYGFKIIPDYEVGDMKLLAKIQALEIRSHNLLLQEGGERPLLDRWAQYLAGRSDDDLGASPELKGLLRGGVPHEYRPRVWRWMVQTRTRTIREHYPECYQQLCGKIRTSPHPTSRQIELDLHRTLTTNQHFSSPSSPALQQLRRVLLAFSWRNPAIGYCQGLNRLAAIALLVLQSEEDAFWCLVAVVEAIMPQDYYTKNLVASQADQRVLKDFLSEKLPRLAAHFDEHAIDVSLITFNWFLVVFVESLPGDILLPLWDAFLYEGTKVIFRYALAVFKYKEDDILKICDSVEIYQYLRFFTKTISDGRRLIGIAFGDMNPFPRRLLRNRRALHLERLQGELQELEEQQKQFVTEHAEHKDKELDTMVSEDDEEL